MGCQTKYYESVDYTWALARQLDRVADAYSRIDPRAPGLGLGRLLMAVRALYSLASIWAPREGLEALRRAEAEASRARAWRALSEIDRALGLLLGELDKRGLLVRKQELPVGSYGFPGGEE